MRDERPQATELRLPLEAAAPSPRRAGQRARVLGAFLVVSVALLAPFPWWARALVALAIAVGLARSLRRATAAVPPPGWVCLDAVGIVRTEGTTVSRFAQWDEPFGMTVLANETHTRAVLAFTTPSQTRYLGVRLEVHPDDPLAPRHGNGGARFAGDLLARAVTVADGDLVGDARVSLSAKDATRLLRAASARSPRAVDRIYLSDPRGESIVLDGTALSVGARTFDLSLPLEWRGSMFHEAGASVATLYQATWVRQGGMEVVLVAPMPAELSMLALVGSGTEDISAPPRELRVAIERLFMLPLRRALDRAPRASRAEAPPPGGPHAVQT
jgi:hypothetical protein